MTFFMDKIVVLNYDSDDEYEVAKITTDYRVGTTYIFIIGGIK